MCIQSALLLLNVNPKPGNYKARRISLHCDYTFREPTCTIFCELIALVEHFVISASPSPRHLALSRTTFARESRPSNSRCRDLYARDD